MENAKEKEGIEMKKHVGKLLSFVLAVAMVLAMMVVPAVADQTASHTITISNVAGDTASHTYSAYQIFKGDYDKTSKVLSNIEWGDGISEAGKTALYTKFSLTRDDQTAAKVAEEMKDIKDDSADAKAIADVIGANLGTAQATGKTSPISVIGDGYYFVKDDDTSDANADTAKTRYILQVVGDVQVTAKSSTPTVEKKVKEKNDTTGEGTGWQDAADYDIGDEVPYQITGTLPSTFADYKTYKTYTFTDILSDGLTITDDELKAITITADGTSVTDKFGISFSNQVLTISLKEGQDLKTWNPALTATSKIVVNYSATLNDKAKIGSEGNPNTVNLTFSNNPNAGGEGDKGKTPDDKVIVFTYEIKANKVDEDGKTPLEGAGFTLYKKGSDGNYTAVGDEITGVTTFEFKGTDAGEYKLVETTVPAGYNKAEDITFTVTATYDTKADDPKLTSLTVTPTEANFTVTTTSDDGKSITTDGIASTNIKNKKGSTLPSTGGIGTTIFYVLGAALVIIAAVVLVARRKKSVQ